MTIGLDDVVAAETALSDVDGLAGRLIIAGHSLDELAGHASFEDVASILIDRSATAADIGQARVEVHSRLIPALGSVAKLPVFDATRAAMALLTDDNSREAALALLAAPAVLVPALLRLRAGDAPLAPDPKLVEKWRARLAELPSASNVGISWRGGLLKTLRRWASSDIRWKAGLSAAIRHRTRSRSTTRRSRTSWAR